MQAFQNLYGFLSQVIPYQDSDLERLYVFIRHLSAKLPRRTSGQAYRFDDEVKLEYYRLQKISEGSISLREGDARRLDGPAEVGSGVLREQPVRLSQLIDLLNERFGTDFNQADQLFFDQIIEEAVTDEGLRQAAAVNPPDKFELLFRNVLERLFIERMDQNEDIFIRFMNVMPFQKTVTTWAAGEAYRRLRSDAAAANTADGASRPRLRIVNPSPKERYTTCVPLVTLKAAAGAFGDAQHVDEQAQAWVAIEGNRRLRPGMFVAQVAGKSMEPRTPDGAWCLFVGPIEGTRQGRVVLVQHRDIHDPDTDARFTVKRYESEKVADGEGGWRHSEIRLLPINPSYRLIVLEGIEEGEISVIAELVEVLGTEGPADRPVCDGPVGKP